jgi:hypothetical protein
VWGIVAQVHLTHSGLFLLPISLLGDGAENAIVNLSFSNSQSSSKPQSIQINNPPEIKSETEDNFNEALEDTPLPPVNRHIAQLITELENIAEQGQQTSNNAQIIRCQTLLYQLQAMGVTAIAQFDLRDKHPVTILQLRYICHLLTKLPTPNQP